VQGRQTQGLRVGLNKVMVLTLNMGASTVEWTTHDPCLVLSESDSILCIIFEFCEKKSQTFKKHIDLQSQAICHEK
jgi:hypothetical protein